MSLNEAKNIPKNLTCREGKFSEPGKLNPHLGLQFSHIMISSIFHKRLFLDKVFNLRTVHSIISTVNNLWVAYTSVPSQSQPF